MAAWDLGFHTKQPSRVAPGFKLSHLCPRGLLGIDGGTVNGGEDRAPHCISWPPEWASHAASRSRDSQELTFLDNFRGGFKPRYLVKLMLDPPQAQPGAHRQSTAAGCSPRGQPCWRHQEGSQPRPCRRLRPLFPPDRNSPDPSPCLRIFKC